MSRLRSNAAPWLASALLASSVMACAPINGPAQAANDSLAHQAGKTLRLEGIYAAWAPCEYSGPKTRSDWVLTYTSQGVQRCVFVTGGLPTGLVPPPSLASVGLPTVVSGVVALNEAGKPYLVFVQSGSAAVKP